MPDLSESFNLLYSTVLELEKSFNGVTDDLITNAIKKLHEAYSTDNRKTQKWMSSSVANYSDPAFRCAYLHKYAMLYSDMVSYLFRMALNYITDNYNKNYYNLFPEKQLNICSLGGGPGTDIVGLLAAIDSRFDLNVSIIDYAKDWENTFSLIMGEMKNNGWFYTAFRSLQYRLSYKYLNADLLSDWTDNENIRETIKNADIVTMVKFLSAVAYEERTENMIKKIFNTMRSGGMLLFIDNAGGGYHKLMKKVAKTCRMDVLYEKLHYSYENPNFKIKKYGYWCQSQATVTFVVFYKRALDIVAEASVEYKWQGQSFGVEDRLSRPANYLLKPELREKYRQMVKKEKRAKISLKTGFIILCVIIFVAFMKYTSISK